MLRSLYTAATGMDAQQTKLDIIAHNLANTSTTDSSVRARTSKTCFRKPFARLRPPRPRGAAARRPCRSV